jgi:cellulose synthase/poly-beta-1,6-N-acetylglucosamine synthase-like glycosyltransferase
MPEAEPSHNDASRAPVSVVICAYTDRRFSALSAAVAKTLEQLREADEVVVVIDHNAALLRRADTSFAGGEPPGRFRVQVVANRNERGLSGARNTGVAVARGQLVVFLDDDAEPRANWLRQLTAAFSDPSVIGTGGVAEPAWKGVAPRWLPAEFLWVVGCSYLGLPEAPTEIRNPIGANMAFRRDTVLGIGGFTDGIGRVGRTPLGCEETELSIRARAATGGRIMQQPTAAVDHLVPADRLTLGYFIRRCWAEGISKAVVSRLVGSSAALASERRYITRTLPIGVIRGFRDGILGDPGGFARAVVIIGGFTVTVAGYARGRAARLQPA